jgi:ribonuclease PH
VCGAYVALAIAARGLVDRGLLRTSPLRGGVAAVSVSILDGIPHLDPDYSEDVGGDADMNIVLDDQDRVIEWQTTAEGIPVTEASVAKAFAVAKTGIANIRALQAAAISGAAK